MQSDIYPLCPYPVAWNPAAPLATVIGGALPGPTVLVHVAAAAGATGICASTSRAAISARRTTDVLAKILDVQLPVTAAPIDFEEVRARAHPEARVGAALLRIGSHVEQQTAIGGEDVHLKRRSGLGRTEQP